jgi:hypothetical protein
MSLRRVLRNINIMLREWVRIDNGDSMERLTYERINGRRKRRKHKFKLRKQTHFWVCPSHRGSKSATEFLCTYFCQQENRNLGGKNYWVRSLCKVDEKKKEADLIMCRLTGAEMVAEIKWNYFGNSLCRFFTLATLKLRVLGLITARDSWSYHDTQLTSPIRYFKLPHGILESFASSDFVKCVPSIFKLALKSDSLKS